MRLLLKLLIVTAVFPVFSLSAQDSDIMNMNDLTEEELVKIYGAPDTLYQEWGFDIVTALYSDSEDIFQFWINDDGSLSLGHYILSTDRFSVNGIRVGDSIKTVRQLEGRMEDNEEGELEWFPPTWFYPNDCTGVIFYYDLKTGLIVKIRHSCAMV